MTDVVAYDEVNFVVVLENRSLEFRPSRSTNGRTRFEANAIPILGCTSSLPIWLVAVAPASKHRSPLSLHRARICKLLLLRYRCLQSGQVILSNDINSASRVNNPRPLPSRITLSGLRADEFAVCANVCSRFEL